MKKFIKLLISVALLNLVFIGSIYADGTLETVTLESTQLESSQTALEKANASYSNSGSVITAEFQGVTAKSKQATLGWGNPDLPGEGDWSYTDANPVGGSISDITFPVFLSMFFIYFLYRGVSSKKRKSL